MRCGVPAVALSRVSARVVESGTGDEDGHRDMGASGALPDLCSPRSGSTRRPALVAIVCFRGSALCGISQAASTNYALSRRRVGASCRWTSNRARISDGSRSRVLHDELAGPEAQQQHSRRILGTATRQPALRTPRHSSLITIDNRWAEPDFR